jgi:hypothetical protein|tara:strand:+ start:2368 stop:3519 length:1152 start_codon:yes stop_codon:yes gene_type:complete
MSQARIWTGTSTFTSGSSTPFGIYDTDASFQSDAPKVANWCAKRLGYPIIDVELESDNLFAVFEEAVSEYSSQVNQFNIRNNMGALEGHSTGSNYQGKSVNGSEINNVVTIAEGYGNLANVGGRADVKKGYINVNTDSQTYDLQSLWGSVSESGERIDVTTVYYESSPAIQRFFDPYSVSGQGTLNLVDEFGFGSFSPAAQFIMMPIYEDMLRIQQIEFNDQIRKSAHSFNIVNNKITILPKPASEYKLWFEYQVVKDRREGNTIILPDVVSDYSNIGYDFAKYAKINDVGRQWIRKYTLALAKEMLGAIREKYNTVPIPGSEVSLDGAALRAEAQTEKDSLIEQLRENLDAVSKKVRMENEAAMVEQQQQVMTRVPLNIYVG